MANGSTTVRQYHGLACVGPQPQSASFHLPPPPTSPHLPLQAESMQRYGGLLHSWLRPQFLDPDFLDRAKSRWAEGAAGRMHLEAASTRTYHTHLHEPITQYAFVVSDYRTTPCNVPVYMSRWPLALPLPRGQKARGNALCLHTVPVAPSL